MIDLLDVFSSALDADLACLILLVGAQVAPDRTNWPACLANGCDALIPPDPPLSFCGPHWRQLPHDLRARLRDTQPGETEHLRAVLVATTHLSLNGDTHTPEGRH